ncbi:aminoglycoside phosphotransferase family protein [Streptomyces sp. RFCAC02]|uniref:phosphotransferase family protein n=1 Tax=Streptomyces sp. RFCAC02 TaxID=2499143 RepID=UPI0010223DF5|nr:aminoglycoside phosphotransferase family protein [Streptomyces sp. RFCAC02]
MPEPTHVPPPVLAAAGIDPESVAAYEPLGGGTYNTVHRIRLADGTRLVLKRPPAPHRPRMTYEDGLIAAEAVFFREAAAHGAATVPRVVSADDDHLLMTELPGAPWFRPDDAPAPVPAALRPRLRYELGAAVARLHAVTGSRWGYPGGAVPAAADWTGTFGGMLAALLADADRYDAPLPVATDRVRELAAAASPALAEVTVPALVHFDLWEGNILLDGEGLSGLIDGERMFWGDPLAEFASLTLLSAPEPDDALIAGYASEGGRTDFDAPARARMAFYRAYLYLIMLVESVPRAYPPERTAYTVERVTPHLTAALDVLADFAGTGS